MGQTTETYSMLDLMLRPAFFVKDNRIVKANAAALERMVPVGEDIRPLLVTGGEEYAALDGECLCLQLSAAGSYFSASILPLEDGHIFLLDDTEEEPELRALALAARELREPLSGLLAISQGLLPNALPKEDPELRGLLASMSKRLHQMQRILGNMSDAGQDAPQCQQEIRNIPGIFEEIFQKAAAFLASAGIDLEFRGPWEDIYGLIDAPQMERAVLNVLSNAVKFLPEGGHIQAELSRRGTFLRLSILDNGPGIPEDLRGSLFSRYLRQPGLEDRRFGLGLGMRLIRRAAIAHGGAVLIDQPKEGGTRVTMTMKLRQNGPGKVHCPRMNLTGGQDQTLIELSDVLPASAYEKEV